ncbi:hypothetical protein [Streptomyces sp. NPDC006446]|uniref:DUF4190 domain-containing protein n=1 Tax=Streptomyces sp. NPDC006446 TaxID=3154301 RepID=UPI0033AB00F5
MSDDAQRPNAPRDAGAWAPPGEGDASTAPGDGNPTPARNGSPVVDAAPGAEPRDAIPEPTDAIPEPTDPIAEPTDAIPEPTDAIPGADSAPADAPDPAAPPVDSGPDSAPEESARWVDSAFGDGPKGGDVPKGSVPGQGTPPFAAPAAAPEARVSLGKPAVGRDFEPNPWAPPEEEPNPWAPPVEEPRGWAPPEVIASSPGSALGSATPPPVYGLPTITSFPGAPVAPGPGGLGGPSMDNPFAPPGAHTPYPQPAPGEHVPPPPIAPDGPGRLPYGYGYPQYGAARPGFAHPGAPGYGWPVMQPLPSNGMGTAGLVLGIIAAVLFCAWPLAIVLGILAVIFGLIGRGKARRGEATNPGQALAGVICGAVGIVLAIALLVLIIVAPDDDGGEDPGGDYGFSTSLVTHRR